MLSVNQKIYIKEGLENTVVCHFHMLESAHFRPRIHPIAFGGQAPPGPAEGGGAYSAPQYERMGRAGNGNERERERKGTTGGNEEKRGQGKRGEGLGIK